MPRRWIFWALFFSSYSPLFLLVSLRSIGTSTWLVLIGASFAAVGLIGTGLFLTTVKKKNHRQYKLVAVENRDTDVAAYTATYLLPFLTVFSGTWQDLSSLGALIAIFGLVYVRSRLIYVNPVLSILGYRLWRVIAVTPHSDENPEDGTWPYFLLVHKESVQKNDVIEASVATEDLLIYKGCVNINE